MRPPHRRIVAFGTAYNGNARASRRSAAHQRFRIRGWRHTSRRFEGVKKFGSVILSADFMILRLTTVRENGSLEVTPVFSTKASAIFIAAKDDSHRFFHTFPAVGSRDTERARWAT